MINLLEETKREILSNGEKIEDIICVQNCKGSMSWDDFCLIADFNYDDGYGWAAISEDLMVIGSDFWLERHEYVGAENWEFKKYPKIKEKFAFIKEDIINEFVKLGEDYT